MKPGHDVSQAGAVRRFPPGRSIPPGYPMKSLVLAIRDRYHPLFHLRKFRAFQVLTRHLDIPVAIRIPAIDHKVVVSLSKNLSLVLSGGGAGEEQERDNFQKLVSLGGFRRFFDVGANVGLYGFMFRNRVPGSAVTLFEPDPANARLLRRTIDGSGVKDVALVCAAVADKPGEVTFHQDSLSGATGSIRNDIAGGLFVRRHHNLAPAQITVAAVKLDSVATPGSEPDFIKIDVEGAELQVLRGARSLIATHQPAIFFECDQNDIPVRNFLVQNGYEVLDFVTMQPVEKLAHNNLALHRVRHAAILGRIGELAPGR